MQTSTRNAIKSKLSSLEFVIGLFSSKNHITSAVSPSGTPIEEVFYLTIRKSAFFYPYAREIGKNGGVWKVDLGPRKAAVASRIRLHSTPRTFLGEYFVSCIFECTTSTYQNDRRDETNKFYPGLELISYNLRKWQAKVSEKLKFSMQILLKTEYQ